MKILNLKNLSTRREIASAGGDRQLYGYNNLSFLTG
tara:strand:- start:5799 stop:5906 length:108 start_codon:yes stop_codon:yes gene_type:complete